MNHLSTAREAFIAETLGEVATLLDRVEAVAPALDASRLALVNASTELAGQDTAGPQLRWQHRLHTCLRDDRKRTDA